LCGRFWFLFSPNFDQIDPQVRIVDIERRTANLAAYKNIPDATLLLQGYDGHLCG
jgi:hypothetical protein